MTCSTLMRLAGATLIAALASASEAATPADLQAAYSALSASAAAPERGQQLFTSRHGREWSCSSCHGAVPTRAGRHASTGKAIGPLAPAFNPERFTDAAERVREAPPEDRITRSARFLRKHDEVPAGAWKRPAVKSPANCSACHTQAAEGDFNEHAVRIPR
jgi:mono/diheme cytochrome c family protein